MKKPLIIIILFLLSIVTLVAVEAEDMETPIRGFTRLYPTINHARTSLHPGIAFGNNVGPFPLLAANISLDEMYFLEACFGAGAANDIAGGLAQYSIGLGIYDETKKRDDLYYSLSLSLRNFSSIYINSSALVVEALLEERVDNLYFGLGLNLISQDYDVLAGGGYFTASDRIYHALFVVYARTGLIDVRASGLPGSFNVNFSMNLNMEKK